MLSLLALIHLIFVIALTHLSSRRLFTGVATQFAAGFLLVWTNLVYTGLILASISELNNIVLYFTVSVLLAMGVYWVVRLAGPSRPWQLVSSEDKEPLTRWQRTVLWLAGSSFSIALLANVTIGLRYFPNNWDTLAYRFSRVFFYLAQGHLLHFGSQLDPRMLTYPINGTLAYMFLAIYGLSGRAYTFVSLACWIFSGIGIYLLSRGIGASRFGSFVASWLCLMSPIVLCVATSTNDEILAAAPTAVGLAFALAAFRRWNSAAALIGIVGVSLGFGVKLHWIFFAPFLCAIAALALFRLGASSKLRSLWLSRLPVLALSVVLGLPLVSSFAVCNLISVGKVTNSDFALAGLNYPFRLDVAKDKIWVNTAQLFLAPIPDLQIHRNLEKRRDTYVEFNEWLNRNWFRNVRNDPAFRAVSYRFQGVADPTGYSYFEQTLWVGFLPVLLLVCLLAGFFRRDVSILALGIGAGFFFWHLSFAAQTRYAETVSTYYSYPAILCSASLGAMIDRMNWRSSIVNRLLVGIATTVALTHIIFALNMFAFNVQRNLVEASKPEFDGETVVTRTSPHVIQAIKANSRIHILYTHWEVLYWTLMRHNPFARYTTSPIPLKTEPGVLNLVSVESNLEAGRLVGRYPESGSAGLVFLGTGYSGGENIFAAGNSVEKIFPLDKSYFLFPAAVVRRPGTDFIASISVNAKRIIGLSAGDGVEFRVYAVGPDDSRWYGRWMDASGGEDQIVLDQNQKATAVAVEARLRMDPSKTCELAVELVPPVIRPEQSTCSEGRFKPLSISFGPKVAGLEDTNWSGNSYRVRWLDQNTEFTILNPGLATAAFVNLELGIAQRPKHIALSHNGESIRGPKITKFFWVNGPQAVNFAVRLAPGRNVFTLNTVEGADRLSDGRPAALLLIHASVTPQLLAGAGPARLELPLAGGSATAKMGKDAWSPEVAMWGDREYPVRWIQSTTSFTINNEGKECDATVRMFLDVAVKPHVAILVANGTPAVEKPKVTKVLWVNGPQELKFKVRLKAGLNEFQLTSPDVPDELPGGRRVQFLLVGDIVASPL